MVISDCSLLQKKFNMIQVTGVVPFTELPVNPVLFTEFSIQDIIKIPKLKPDVEQLISASAEIEVISERLVKTPAGISNEGQNLSGFKLILELKIRQIIRYAAYKPDQSVHAVHFDKTLSSVYIVVPPIIKVDSVGIPIKTVFSQRRLKVSPYIEYIYAEARDQRTIYENFIVLVDVKTV